MQPIDLSKGVPDGVDVLWNEHGVRYDRSASDPDYWTSEFVCLDEYHVSELRGTYYPEPPHCRTWAELIRPDTDYYAHTERPYSCSKYRKGVCRSDKAGHVLVFEDGTTAHYGEDIVKHAFPTVPADRLSLPATGVFDLLFKTQGLEELKTDVIEAVKATYDTYGRG